MTAVELDELRVELAQARADMRAAVRRTRGMGAVALAALTGTVLLAARPAAPALAPDTLPTRLAADEARLRAVEQKTAPLITTGDAHRGYLLRISTANVQIVNGMGSTSTADGLGNLIIGYDHGVGVASGSHNLVLGDFQTYESYGGLVAGQGNTLLGPYASVLGGQSNTAAGSFSCVVGGQNNVTGAFDRTGRATGHRDGSSFGADATVGGGFHNTAGGPNAAVGGGFHNTAGGGSAWVGGGQGNLAAGPAAWVGGGTGDLAGGGGDTGGEPAGTSGATGSASAGPLPGGYVIDIIAGTVTFTYDDGTRPTLLGPTLLGRSSL